MSVRDEAENRGDNVHRDLRYSWWSLRGQTSAINLITTASRRSCGKHSYNLLDMLSRLESPGRPQRGAMCSLPDYFNGITSESSRVSVRGSFPAVYPFFCSKKARMSSDCCVVNFVTAYAAIGPLISP